MAAVKAPVDSTIQAWISGSENVPGRGDNTGRRFSRPALRLPQVANRPSQRAEELDHLRA